jgi:hypothetical protein
LIATDVGRGVAETYYRINDGSIYDVRTHGQPNIAIENANNTLEYWSVDNARIEELPHKILTGIKLDKSPPTVEIPSREPAGDVHPDQPVKVSINVTDATSNLKNVTLYYTLDNGTTWEESVPTNPNAPTSLYEATIPGQQPGTWVKYKIVAHDYAGNNATLDGTGPYCTYQVIPEFSSTIILPLFTALSLITIIFTRKKLLGKLKN